MGTVLVELSWRKEEGEREFERFSNGNCVPAKSQLTVPHGTAVKVDKDLWRHLVMFAPKTTTESEHNSTSGGEKLFYARPLNFLSHFLFLFPFFAAARTVLFSNWLPFKFTGMSPKDLLRAQSCAASWRSRKHLAFWDNGVVKKSFHRSRLDWNVFFRS